MPNREPEPAFAAICTTIMHFETRGRRARWFLTLMWTIAAAYFLARGGGVYSLDHLLGL